MGHNLKLTEIIDIQLGKLVPGENKAVTLGHTRPKQAQNRTQELHARVLVGGLRQSGGERPGAVAQVDLTYCLRAEREGVKFLVQNWADS